MTVSGPDQALITLWAFSFRYRRSLLFASMGVVRRVIGDTDFRGTSKTGRLFSAGKLSSF